MENTPPSPGTEYYNTAAQVEALNTLDDRSNEILAKQRTSFYLISIAGGDVKKNLRLDELLTLELDLPLKPQQCEAIIKAIHNIDPIEDWINEFSLDGVTETDLAIIETYLGGRNIQFMCSKNGEARVGLERVLKTKLESELTALNISSLNEQLDQFLDTLFGGVQTYDEPCFATPLKGVTPEQQQTLLKYFRKAGLFTEIYQTSENEIDLFINLNPNPTPQSGQ